MATITKKTRTVVGSLYMTVCDVTFSASYTTGGEALRGSVLGLPHAPKIVLCGETGAEVAVYDRTNQKLKLFTADGVEATNASNQSAITVTIVAIG